MVDLKMLAARTLLLASVLTLVGTAAFRGAWVLIPNFVGASSTFAHYGFDASNTDTGLYLLPAAAAGFFTGLSACASASATERSGRWRSECFSAPCLWRCSRSGTTGRGT